MKDTKMNLNDMTVPELRQLAAELSVSGRSKMKKADLIDAIESAQETDAILADEETMAAIAEAESEETLDDLRALLANAEADAECERARRLAEYDAEDEARALLADTTPRRVYSVPTEGVRLDVDHYDSRAATIDVYTNAAGLDRILYAAKKGRVWEIATEDNGVRTAVRALSLNKLVKRWAKRAGIWADITITRSY